MDGILKTPVTVLTTVGLCSSAIPTSCTSQVCNMCRVLPKSRSKFRSQYDDKFPAVITLRHNHNHAHNIAAVLKHRDMSDSTRQKLIDLFHRGHSPSSALHSVKMELMVEHPEEYHLLSADSSLVPSYSIVCHLYKAEFSKEYGELSGQMMINDLEKFVDTYNTTVQGGQCCFGRVDNNYFVAVCTPLMARVHAKVPQAAEVLLVDASGGMDRQKHRVYMFVTPTVAGGLPVGAIVANCERQAVFADALQALIGIMPDQKFFGYNQPNVIITDNDLKERTPLSQRFPEATLLLCQFHVLKSVWSWLCDTKNGVSALVRQEIYFALKACMYTHSIPDMEKKYHELLSKQYCNKNSKLHKYLSGVWASRNEWASCFRLGLPVRGSNTTNYVEVVFKVLKDCIFDRVLAYNVTQLLDFLVTRYEQYMERRLLDFANGRYSKVLLKQMMPAASAVNSEDIVDDGEGSFTVPSETQCDVTYTVDIAKGVCSCFAGSSGVLCKHISAVMCKVDSSISVSPGLKVANKDSRTLMFEVATGKKPSAGWLSPLKMVPHSVHTADDTDDHDSTQPSSNASADVARPECSLDIAEDLPADEWCCSAIEDFCGRVKQGLQENFAAFKPAVVKMHRNLQMYAASETGLLTTLHTMGKYTGLPVKRKLTAFSGRRHGGVMIGVQPTATKRRKSCLSGRRRFCGGRPMQVVKRHSALAQHDYGPLAPPPRKRKCQHNIEKCVYSNVSLGSSRQAKS